MCLRLFRNFVHSKIPGVSKRSKRQQAQSNSKEALSYSDVEKGLQFPVKLGDNKVLNGHTHALTINADNPHKDEVSTLVNSTPAEEERRLWDALPPVSLLEPEDINVDPSKAYLSALPVELKLEILDQLWGEYSIPTGSAAYQTFTRFISQNRENLRALKEVRLCDREMSHLGLQRLFIVANLTPHGKRLSNWVSLFEKSSVFPTIAQYIKYITVYLDEESDPMMARVLRQLPNVKWLMLDLNLQSAALESIDVLRKYTNVIRLTTISSGPLPISHMEANTQFIKAYGKNLKTLDLFNAWNHDPTDSLLRTIRDSCPSLENIYIYGTADTSLASILVEEPTWSSRATLRTAHFEACKEIDAWIVASIVNLYPALTVVDICSCGGPGDYDNAAGREEERVAIMKHLKPMQRPPLESLRIVHATDVEFRHMCLIPTRKLLIYDPLDQKYIGQLLSQQTYWPGLRTVELEYVKEPNGDDEAFQSIRDAVERRGHCQFVDTRDKFKNVRRFF